METVHTPQIDLKEQHPPDPGFDQTPSRTALKTILEGGHYYKCKGPTTWSIIGWNQVQALKQPGDQSMVFVDDVHEIKDLHPTEAVLPSFPHLIGVFPDYMIMESTMIPLALHLLEELASLPKKKRAKQKPNGQWFCSGFPITDPEGFPLCVLLDLALTKKKAEMGFERVLNVLPQFYEEQQVQLRKLIQKVIPTILHDVVLYDLEGKVWQLPTSSPLTSTS